MTDQTPKQGDEVRLNGSYGRTHIVSSVDKDGVMLCMFIAGRYQLRGPFALNDVELAHARPVTEQSGGGTRVSERSARSYELEIGRLEKALSDECANSYRIAQELKDAQRELVETKLQAHHQVVRSEPVTFTRRTDTPPSGPAPKGLDGGGTRVSERETPARRAIRAALAEHGLTADGIEWTPVGRMIVMQGHSGGWFVHVPEHGVVTGINWRETVDQIHRVAPGWLDGSISG